jgi:hypothetical protein
LRWRLSVAGLASLSLASAHAAPKAASGATTTDTRPTSRPELGTGPADRRSALDSAKTKPPKGKKIDFDSTTVKSVRAQLSALRNDYKAWLRANVPGAKVTASSTSR